MTDTYCIDYDGYLADDDSDDKGDDIVTMIFGANDVYDRDITEKNLTISKQVKRTLNFKLERRTSRGSGQFFFPGSSWGRVGEEPVNEVGG